MKQILTPFGEVDKKTRIGIILFWIILALGSFEIFHNKIIPPPSRIGQSILDLVTSSGFYEDLIASLITTSKAMFYSILLTVVIVYLSVIQLFKPIANFVSKCRYLTLTGLIFVFTVLSKDTAELKMYLLIFGIVPFFVTSFYSTIHSAPIEERWKAYVNRLGRWGALYETVIVGKLDVLFEVMRQNFAISWMMITMVEGYAMSEGGIGTLLIKSNKYLDLGPVFAMLVIVLVLGLLFDFGLSALRKMLFPYLLK